MRRSSTYGWIVWCWVILLLSCSRADPDPLAPDTPKGYRYLALGDSYTIGQGVAEDQRFPHQLVELMRGEGVMLQTPVYIAQTGWATDQLRAAIKSMNPIGPFDLVTLLIGVNDQFRGRDTGIYAGGFRACLDDAIALAGNRSDRVVVLSIPDYSVTPVGRNWDSARVTREIDLFNTINRRITETYGIAYLDITGSSRRASTNPLLVATDGLHPSGLEYRSWSTLLVPLVSKIIP